MKRVLVIVFMLLAGIGVCTPQTGFAYDFGDYRSLTLTTRAWEALEKGDIEAVLAYTNKCIELYGEQAKAMQSKLTGYASGSSQEIFSYWALNDVATSLFIQGEAYRKAKMYDEAKEVFNRLINDYAYGQCWDAKGWFWKPAEVAKEKLVGVASGTSIDFGDMSSGALTTKAWKALLDGSLEGVLAYTNKCIELYDVKAKEMQASLTAYPTENEKIFAYWPSMMWGRVTLFRGKLCEGPGSPRKPKRHIRR